MGWDRIRYFEGVDGESTLISADKASARTVYGYKFGAFAARLGFEVRRVVDLGAVTASEYLQTEVNQGNAELVDFPAIARKVWYGKPLADTAVELRPPVNEETLRILNAFLLTMCEPNDAALILDDRSTHEVTLAEF